MFQLLDEIKDADFIGISGHIKPDGDCIGSCLGLALYLKKACPQKTIKVYLQEPGYSFRNIPGLECIDSNFTQPEKEFDLFFSLDTVPERMGDAYTFYQKAAKTINVDHHISNADGSGMVNYVVPSASAASELITELLFQDKQYVDADIAELLYMGIAHDTGVFKFSNTSPKTLRIVADLVEYGFDFPKLLDETFYEKTELQNKMQSLIVLGSKRYFDGKVIVGTINQKQMQEYGATKNDFDGVVNQLRITEGVECAVFMYEKEPQLFKASLRASSDLIDVARIAVVFGGGGHVRASGCDLRGEEDDLVARILDEIAKQL